MRGEMFWVVETGCDNAYWQQMFAETKNEFAKSSVGEHFGVEYYENYGI